MARVDSADVHFAIYFPKNNNSMGWDVVNVKVLWLVIVIMTMRSNLLA